MQKAPSKRGPENPDRLKQWAMILLESLSVGVVAIVLVLAVVLLAVSVYVQVVWPLTDWDLVGVDLNSCRDLATFALVVISMAGSAVGFWFISGVAWGGKTQPRTK